MKCPHCNSHFYDGNHCYSCSRSKPKPIVSIKNTITLQCKRCGKEYQVYEFYGTGNLDHIDSEQRKYCNDCKLKLTSIASAEYKAEHGLLGKTTAKRLKQWHNYLEYIGERAA